MTTASFLAAAPSQARRGPVDYGPFLSYSVRKSLAATRPSTGTTQPTTAPSSRKKQSAKQELVAAKGITINVGDGASICFDADLMRYAAGWTGGFLDLSGANITRLGQGEPGAVEAGPEQFRTATVPGWSAGASANFDDPRPDGDGPMPQTQARYSGLYRHGRQVVLSYTAGDASILDLPGAAGNDSAAAQVVFTRTIRVDHASAPMHLLICDVDHGTGKVVPSTAAKQSSSIAAAAGNIAVVNARNGVTCASVVNAPGGATLEVTPAGRVILHLPAGSALFQVRLCRVNADQIATADALLHLPDHQLIDPASLCKGGPSLWNQPVVTAGSRGTEDAKFDSYVVDTIRLPDDNPWHAWIRPGGLDFFPDGRVAICTFSGDVWIGSGIDESLQHVSWKRFASGLYEPLGLKIVDGLVYVLGRDQITRLHDLDGDGEADWYENFNNDFVTLPVYHAFAFDLQTDRAGNFYFVVGGNWVKPGERDHSCAMKVSKDGKYIEHIGSGLRAPNGDGMSPNDEFVCGDNEGHWTPACRINLIKPGGFYGYVTDPRQVTPETASKVVKHDSYDPPICWIPMSSDNSTGGQVWATSDKWGALDGQMLSTSYGKSSLYEVIYESTDGIPQGGTIRLPLKFDSGIMRARFNPVDGQLYVCGLRGWQTTATRDGTLQRVRYTGKPVNIPIGIHVKHDGIEIDFSCRLDPETAADEQSYAIEQWNYLWRSEYGSPEFKVSNPKAAGHDVIDAKSAKLLPDGKSVFLEIPGLKPVMQMSIQMKLETADHSPVNWTVYNTINKVP